MKKVWINVSSLTRSLRWKMFLPIRAERDKQSWKAANERERGPSVIRLMNASVSHSQKQSASLLVSVFKRENIRPPPETAATSCWRLAGASPNVSSFVFVSGWKNESVMKWTVPEKFSFRVNRLLIFACGRFFTPEGRRCWSICPTWAWKQPSCWVVRFTWS